MTEEATPISPPAPSLDTIVEAREVLKGYTHQTPIITCHALDELLGQEGRHLFFKCELFQKTGSFKARGATNALSHTPPQILDVVTHSSGNHAQAVAWACRQKGLRAHIVMPSNAPAIKVKAVKGYGAQVYLCEPTLEARESTANRVLKETDGVLLHPFDNPYVISGQGTVGLEMMEQVEEERGVKLDALVVPVGGGGLISGIATAVKGLNPEVLVIGAEPKNADDAARSKAVGSFCSHLSPPQTIADGLLTTTGKWTLPIILKKVDRIVTVSEREIAKGMRLVYERCKLVIEPSAGVGVAVALGRELREVLPNKVKNIGVVLCGGNLDLERLPGIWALAEEEEMD